jgi:drug/metabolite transporter (DMT)-like permease
VSATAKPRVPPLAVPPARTLAGIGLALLSVALFGTNNAAMKVLILKYPVTEVLALRSTLSLLLLVPMLRVADFRAAWRASPPALHLLRMTMSGLEMFCFFAAVSVLPLADASTLYLATPIYVTAMAPLLLGERVGWRRWVAVVVGFCGVVVALRPSSQAISAPAMIATTGALMYAVVVITTRKLRGAATTVLIATQVLAALIVSLIVAVAVPGGAWTLLSWRDAGLMLCIALMSVSGYAALNRSLRIAPVSVLAPFQYTSLVWAAVLGFLVFAEVPADATLLGGAMIIGAGLFILFRERGRS